MQRLVERYGGCLAALPARQRRVLAMRAGVGAREPATRAVVARRLELPLARVRTAERRGLRTLRRIGRDGCAAVATPDGSGSEPALASAPASGGGLAAAVTVLASGSGGGPQGGSTGSAGGGDSAGGAGDRGGGRDGGSSGAGGVKAISATGKATTGAPTDVTLPLLLLVLGGIAAVAALIRRRSRPAS